MSSELRLLVIGLDGATFDVINPLITQGRLPALATLMAEGATGPLRSTIPPVSAPAWSTFMTGLNPGKHGIFQWRTYDPTKYTCLDEQLMTSSRLAGRTFWDILGNSGYRVGAITVPMTYPAWAVNGFLLAGYPCPDAKRNYTHPPSWADELTESYNFSVDQYVQMPEDVIWREGLEMLKRRTSLAIKLIAEEHVQVCVVVLGEVDRAQHDFWKYTDPRFPAYRTAQGQRYRQVIAEHYQVADVQIRLGGCSNTLDKTRRWSSCPIMVAAPIPPSSSIPMPGSKIGVGLYRGPAARCT
jgi:predicted AlkP superfamily phosphohydrolase/phosphomutase